MLVIQRFGEPLPQAFLKDADGVRAVQGVSAPDFPSKVTVEFADKDKPAAKANREWPRAYGSMTTAKDGCMGNAVAFAKATVENAEFTDLEGRAIAIEDSTLIWEATFTPGVRVGAYHFPARRRFMPAKQVFIRPRVTNAPNVLPFGHSPELTVAIDAPGEAEPILKYASISVTYSDKEGNIDYQPDPNPLDGRRQFMVKARPMSSFGGWLPTTIAVNLSFFSGTLPVSAPAVVRLIHPGELEDLVELSASGVRLYYEDMPATLVCSKMERNPVGETRKPEGIKQHCSVLLLESFTEKQFAPNAGVSLKALLAKHLPDRVSCNVRTVGHTPGSSPNLSMLVEFWSVIGSEPNIAVILPGALAIRGFATPMEATAASLYMVQSCLAKGILPVIVTAPRLPGTNSATVRQEALFLKEMATALGVPVIDLYSMDVMGVADAKTWYNSDMTTTATPNDRAREWLTAQLAKEIMQIINSVK